MLVFEGATHTEVLWLRKQDETEERYPIFFTKYGDEPKFSVALEVDNYGQEWEFWMLNPSMYEIIKYAVFDMMMQCETIEELGDVLNEIFNEHFGDAIVQEEDKEKNIYRE